MRNASRDAGGRSFEPATSTGRNALFSNSAAWSADVGNAPPPPDVTPPVISALSATAVTSASAQVGWTTDEPASSQVEYGTTTAYGSLTALDPALVTTHGQTLTGLGANTTYHYRVRSQDAALNLGLSGDATFTTAAPDVTPPVISAVVATAITNTAATIGWTTDEPATGQVEYGLTASYGATTTLDPSLATSHGQLLGGLTANTVYHFRVDSTDAAGNPSSSTDLVFTTSNTPPLNSLLFNGTNSWATAPSAAELNVTGDWTVEAWFKDETAGGFNHDTAYIVMKGNTDIDSEGPYFIGVGWNTLIAGERTGWTNNVVSAPLGTVSAAAWHHAAASFVAATRTVTLYLDGAQVAQGIIGASSATGNALPVQIGRNGSGAAMWHGKLDDVRIWNVARTAAEVSTNFRSELSSAPASLVGNWKFNEGSGTVAADSTATPQNALLQGGAAWSTDVGNVPPPPPGPTTISLVSAGSITNGSAQISWTTNNPASSQVEYGPTAAYGTTTTLDPALVTSHTQQVSGLASSTLYHYRVRSTDGGGTLVLSADGTFTTAAPPPATTISAVAATGMTNTGATIGWTTNNPASSQVEYGPTATYGTLSPLDPTLLTAHSQTLGGLTVNTLYHYRVRSTDAGGTLVLSADGTFSTTNSPAVNSLLLTGGAAEAANAAELNITGDWTLEAWFKDETPAVPGFQHDYEYIVMKGNTDANAEAPYFLGVGWNSLFAGSRTGWTSYMLSASLAGVPNTSWHHAAASFVAASRTLTLYLDGVQVGQGVLGARSTAGNALPVEIGRNGSGAGVWRGKLDDLRIWNVARTATDMSTSYRTEFATAPAGLVAHWKFNEGAGPTAADSTTPAESATLLGGAGWSTDIHP